MSHCQSTNQIETCLIKHRDHTDPDAGTFVETRFERDSYFALINFCENHDIPKAVQPPYGRLHMSLLRTQRTLRDLGNSKYLSPVHVSAKDVTLGANPRPGGVFQLRLDINSPQLLDRIGYLRRRAGLCELEVSKGDSPLHVTLSYSVTRNWLFKFAKKNVTFNQDLIIIGETISSLGGNDPSQRPNHYDMEVRRQKRFGYY